MVSHLPLDQRQRVETVGVGGVVLPKAPTDPQGLLAEGQSGGVVSQRAVDVSQTVQARRIARVVLAERSPEDLHPSLVEGQGGHVVFAAAVHIR